MAHRMDQVTSFIVMDIVKRASEIPNVVHFEIGEPDVAPAPEMMQGIQEALNQGKMNYTQSLGLPELRQKISEYYAFRYQVQVPASRIAITAGTSGGFLALYAALLSAGEKVALADPSYPCYKNFSYLLDLEPVMVPVDESTHYQITPELLEPFSGLSAVQISSPGNPTGTLYRPDNLKALADYCRKRGIHLISDEIYHGLVYDGVEHTALEYDENALVLNSFSKYFCAPGLRLGWVIVPEFLIRNLEKALQNLFISPPTLSQYGALKAFNLEYLQKTRQIYAERRDFLYEGLSRFFRFDSKPEGAFYLWANVSDHTRDSFEFSRILLEEAGIAATPGIDFGKNRTHEYLRFAYTREEAHLAEGLHRLQKFLKKK